MHASATADRASRRPDPRIDLVGIERWGAVLAGGSLTAHGRGRHFVPGLALAAAATGFTARPFLNPVASIGGGAGAIEVERAVTANRPADELFRFRRDFTILPRFMDHIKEVSVRYHRRSHWVAKAPLDTSVEWNAEIAEERPGEFLAGCSLPGSEIPNEGAVRFSPAPADRGTEVKISPVYLPPAGQVGAAVAQPFGEEPEQQVRENLRRFKAIMESGEAPTIDGQSSGREDGS